MGYVERPSKLVEGLRWKGIRWAGEVGREADVFGSLSSWSWRDLTGFLSRHTGADGESDEFDAPLAVPAGDRWPLTDWFENQLAGNAPDLYDRLSRGEVLDWDDPAVHRPLVQALNEMADAWGDPRVLADGAAGAEASSWSDLPRQVYDRRAALAFGPSFLAGPVDDLPHGLNVMWPVSFPSLDHGAPLVVGGDFAVVPRVAGDGGCARATAGQDFVRWLTDRRAMRQWSRSDGGFITPNARSPHLVNGQPSSAQPQDDVRAVLTALIRPARGARLHFDLSDDRFAVANEGDARRTWEIFADFFHEVTGGGDVGCAVDQTIARLQAEYQGDQPATVVCQE